jgi:TPP-dependent indolepyruvate ferredoxin oxidoreductase alpha subunit
VGINNHYPAFFSTGGHLFFSCIVIQSLYYLLRIINENHFAFQESSASEENERKARAMIETIKAAADNILVDPHPAAELTYFDRTRRQFLKLTGLAVAGLILPEALWPSARAHGAPAPVRIDSALAFALQDAGVQVVTHVPATGATAIFDAYNKLAGTAPSYSFNEEVAYTIAHGAALAGARSAAVIKSHGLAKAANSVIDSLTLGTTAGFVTIALDDPAGSHSDNIFDLEAFLRGTGIPFKKTGINSVYNDTLECFLWSEELKAPVVLFVDSPLVLQNTTLDRQHLRAPEGKYSRDPLRHVLCPPLAPYQRKVLEARLAGIDWRRIAPPALPPVPQGLPPLWRKAASQFVPVFEVFQELRPQIPFVSGDTGLSSLFAFAPFACVDACSYYGGSLPLAIGFHLGSCGRAWAITGDYAFLAAGQMGLIEALARRIPLKVLIMDNGYAMATGGQPIPAGVFEQVLNSWAPYLSRIENPRDKSEVRTILNRAIRSERLEIVSARFRT